MSTNTTKKDAGEKQNYFSDQINRKCFSNRNPSPSSNPNPHFMSTVQP